MKMIKTVLFTLCTIAFFVSCKKEFSYEGGTVDVTNGTWQFQNGSTLYIGDIDSAFIQNVNGTKILILTGRSLVGQQNFKLTLNTADSFTTSTYLSSLSQSEFDYSTSTKTIFTGDFLGGEFTVNITSLSNNNITGTFSGVAIDSTNSQTQINLGTFSSSIDLSNNGNTSGGGNTQSTGTLGANPDTCTPSLVSGIYTTGVSLTALNTVQVEVNVTTPGTFVIATNSVNGINFFKAGSFTTAGVQNVILTGSGTPQIAGLQNFIVTYGNSNCTFQVNFLQGTAPIGDYQPTTLNSNWTYGSDASDSLMAQVISYAPSIGSNVYTTFVLDNVPPSGSYDTTYFRKAGNDYFNYLDASDIFQFDDPVFGEYVLLNDAVPAGTLIKSPDFNGTISGVPVTGYIQATITEKAVPVTVGTLNFDDVIKVTYEYYYTLLPGTPIFTEERWFARGVGLIYDEFDGTVVANIGRYQIM